MANPTIVPKKSVQAAAVPTSQQLALGEICINHADRRIYSRNPSTGAVYLLAGAKQALPATYFFDISGDYLYFGKLAYTDFPQSGSIFDSTAWDITRTTTNTAGDVVSETSATGAWSNRTSLSY